ncbi:MAG: LiaF transmembrane domain-containing protein [Bacillota bacterium]
MEEKEKKQPEQPLAPQEPQENENRPPAEPEPPAEPAAPVEPAAPAEPVQPPSPPTPPPAQPPAPFQTYAPPPPQQAPPVRRRSLAGPLILVFIGAVLLLNNLGVITWSIWEILWRFWPVWLIAMGVDMLLGRRGRWGGLLALALVLTLLGGVFYYVSLWTDPAIVSYQAGERVTINQGIDGAREARVEISPSVSRLEITGGAAAGALVQGSVEPIVGEELEEDFRLSASTGIYRLSSEFLRPHVPFTSQSGGRWSLQLSEEIPLALRVQTGVGRSELDLRSLTLSDLRLSAGVGETTITLPARGQFRGQIDTGVGQTTIRVPVDLGARIRVETGLGGVSVRGDFTREGNYYYSPNYATAAHQVDLTIQGGVGGILIETVR